MPLVKVVPAEGATIRQPNRNMRIMPPEGDIVSTDDAYYSRLILSRDLLEEKEDHAPPKRK